MFPGGTEMAIGPAPMNPVIKRPLASRRARFAALLMLLLLALSACAHLAAHARASVASEATTEVPQSASIESSETDEYSHSQWAPFWSSEGTISTRRYAGPQQTLFVRGLFRPPMGDRS